MTAEERSIFDELVKQAQGAYDALVKVIKDYIDKPTGSITDLKEELLKTINKIVADAKETYQKEVNKIIGDLQEMVECYKKEAEKLGINIKDCYDKTQKDIMALPQGYLTNITQCGTNEYEAGMKLITSATDIIGNVTQEFNTIPNKINDCTKQSWWSATTCITGVIAEIGSMALNIPTKIGPQLNDFVKRIQDFITGVPLRVKLCALNTTTIFAQNATGVGMKFVDCVKNKFPNPNVCLPAY